MILASLVNDAATALAVIGALSMLVVVAALKAAAGVASAAARDARRPGKGKELAARAGTTVLGAVFKRIFLGRWR